MQDSTSRTCFVLKYHCRQLEEQTARADAFGSAAIDCTACGNCCRTCRPVLNESDIDRLAGHLQMAPGEFTGRHLRQEKEEGGWEFAELPCPFLQDNLCTVYEHRPDDCRSYPHLHKNDTIFRLAGIVMNCEVCPIVFNVFEELKNRIP